MDGSSTIEENLFADQPGGWVADEKIPDARVWQGETVWTRACGRSLVSFILGNPHHIEDCLLPDGSRGHVQATMSNVFAVKQGEHWGGRWRRLLPDGSWRHGRIEIHTIEGEPSVQFVDIVMDTQPQAFGDGDVPDMEADMHGSSWFRSLVTDDGFADELYAAMCNVGWLKTQTGAADATPVPWSCSWRSSGGIVADLRNKGEEYLDFYCLGREGQVSQRVAQALAELGWFPLEEE